MVTATGLVVIPFRSNNGAYNALITSFTFTVGGASCPAGFARRQGFLLHKILYLYHFYKMTVHKRSKLSCSDAGQDAPPTQKEKDIINISYALLFKRNGITTRLFILNRGVSCQGEPKLYCTRQVLYVYETWCNTSDPFTYVHRNCLFSPSVWICQSRPSGGMKRAEYGSTMLIPTYRGLTCPDRPSDEL